MSGEESWGGDTTWSGQVVLLSQCESWGMDALRRLILVAAPKDIIDVSTSGDDGTLSVSGGNSVISWDERSLFETS